MEQFTIILHQLVAFALMLVVGYGATVLRVIKEEYLTEFATLISRVLLPILIFANAMHGTSRDSLVASWTVLVLIALLDSLLIATIYLTSRFLGITGNKGRIFQTCFVFSNMGFMGIPILMQVYPETAGISVVLISIIDQVVIWTYGVYMTTPKERRKPFSIRYFMNPVVYAVVSSLLLILLNIPMPEVLEKPLLTIGQSATPLSMIYLGSLMYYSKWIDIFRQKELYVGISIKMLAFPLLFSAVVGVFISNIEMVKTVAMVSMMPSMVLAAMFATMQKNHGEYALGIVLATTAMSLGTMAIVSAILF